MAQARPFDELWGASRERRPRPGFEPLAAWLNDLPLAELARRQQAAEAAFRSLGITDRYAARLPRDPWARSLQAQAHLQAGRVLGDAAWFASAERLALECLELGEPKGYVYRLAATARRLAGDTVGALGLLETSIARGLDHYSVRLDRAELLRALGRHREAHEELLRAQQQAPTDPAVMQALWQSAQPPR